MAKGTITRKDIITDDALTFGDEYSKNLQKAIEKNKEFVSSIKEYSELFKAVQSIQNNNDFKKIKQKEIDVVNQANTVWKEQLQLENQLISVKRKQELATESTNRTLIQERVLLAETNKELKRQTLEKLGLVGAYQKLNLQRTQAKRRLMDLIASEQASSKEIRIAQKEFDALDKKVRKADKAVGDFTKNVGNYPQVTKLAGSIKNLIGAFGIGLGVVAFANGMREAWRTVVEFDKAITELSAVTEVPKSKLGSLRNTIIEVSKTSANTATDVANLAVELSKLGASVPQIETMLKTVDEFSIAMEANASDASSFLLGVLNAFGETAEEVQRYGDVMAQAANISALGFEELQNSLKTFAPVANAAGISIERAAAMTGLLVDNNVEATTTGTSLRAIFLLLAKNGLTYEDAMRKIRTSTDQLKTATQLFGKESSTAALILANNTEKLAYYEAKLLDSEGALKALNEVKMSSLENQFKALGSAWDGFILSIENGDGAIAKFVRGSVSALTGLINYISNANKSIGQIGDETSKKALENTTKNIQEAEKEYSMLQKIREIREKTGLSFKDAKKQAEEYYNTNKSELDSLIEKNKEAFLNSTNITSGIEVATRNISVITKNISETEAKISELEKEMANSSALGNAFLRRQDFLDRENKKLQDLQLSLGTYTSMLKAYQQYSGLSNAPISITETETAEVDEKARKEYLNRLKKQADDEFNLRQFRLKNAIELNNEIMKADETLIKERIDLLSDSTQLEESILRDSAVKKLKDISWYDDEIRDLTQSEIDTLLNGGEIKKELSNSEKLVLEQYLSEKLKLQKKYDDDQQKLIDDEVKRTEKRLKAFNDVNDTELANRITQTTNIAKANLELAQSEEERLVITEQYESEIYQIKADYAKKALIEQINAIQALLDQNELSDDVQREKTKELSEYKQRLAELDLEHQEEIWERYIQLQEENNQRIKDLSTELAYSLIDLTNTIFDARIANIDRELERWNGYYDKQIELAGEDERQKEYFEKEREQKEKELEERRRKEVIKQAIFNKTIALAEIALNLAKTLSAINLAAMLMDTLAPFLFGAAGASYRGLQTGLAIGIAAAQTATVLATPLPKYEYGAGFNGRPEHKGGFAEVGEKRPEVVLEPNKDPYLISRHSILDLPKGTKVVPSIKDYERMQNASILSSLDLQMGKYKTYEANKSFNDRYTQEMISELKQLNKNVKGNKPNVVVYPQKVDLPHSFWRSNILK